MMTMRQITKMEAGPEVVNKPVFNNGRLLGLTIDNEILLYAINHLQYVYFPILKI